MKIRTQADIDGALVALVTQDPELEAIAAQVGPVPLRLRTADFEGLARIIVSQQLSVASASAIWQRLENQVCPFHPDVLGHIPDTTLLSAGLSRSKLKTLRALSAACLAGLNFEALVTMQPFKARQHLTAIHGIGPWTADIFLMFCAGHPDIFPTGDLALQNAVQMALNLRKRPSSKRLGVLARRWRPYRAVAARLLWAYYGVQLAINRGRKEKAIDKLPV